MKEYRGKIPFLLKEIGGKILYLCSSNRNIEDYYNVLSDIYSGNILKLENTQSKDELEKDNYDLLEILKSEEDFIILLSLEAILREYFLEGKRYEIEIGKSLDIKELENSSEENSLPFKSKQMGKVSLGKWLEILRHSFSLISSEIVLLSLSGIFSSGTSIICNLQYLESLLLYSVIASFRYCSLILPTQTILIRIFFSYSSSLTL